MVEALLEWRGYFEFAKDFIIITDNASHFANALMKGLEKRIGFQHNFSIAYSPWINGFVENVNSTILKYLRSLCSEYKLYEADWSTLLPVLNYLINNRPNPHRQNMTPNELFLYFREDMDLIRRDLSYFALRYGNKWMKPKSIKTLILEVDNIVKLLKDKQFAVFKSVKFKRDLKNARLN
eukprot:snap_masked-scaffold_55-processed-gene-1.33-mRNA-1 protein AED:0.30 eAED:0.30 QI:0/-1/0/1/-1/1/1/0/179